MRAGFAASMVVMLRLRMVWMMAKMCSGLCSNRARSLAAIWADAFVAAVDGGGYVGGGWRFDGFENRNEDAVELFDGFGGAVEGVHSELRFCRGCRVGYSLSFRQLGPVVERASLSSGRSAVRWR